MTQKFKLKMKKYQNYILKKIINQSEYFKLITSDQFELFNNILSYNVDNNQYFQLLWELFR